MNALQGWNQQALVDGSRFSLLACELNMNLAQVTLHMDDIPMQTIRTPPGEAAPGSSDDCFRVGRARQTHDDDAFEVFIRAAGAQEVSLRADVHIQNNQADNCIQQSPGRSGRS